MPLPSDYQAFLALSSEQVQALCDELAERPLTVANMDQWLQDWGQIAALFQETMARYDIATAINTADDAARDRLAQFRETILPIGMHLHQRLQARLQAHEDLMPLSLREVTNRRAAAEQLNTSPAAVDLLNREAQLVREHEAILGAQTIEWEGEQRSLRQVEAVYREVDRAQREQAWRAIHTRREQDHAAIERIWAELLDVRQQVAELNGFDDYLGYRWTQLARTDYTPQDSRAMHAALRHHWGPLHDRLMAMRRAALGLAVVRPWDVDAPLTRDAVRPFDTPQALLDKTISLFRRMDGEFAAYVIRLRDRGFIDLAQRTHTSSVGGFSRQVGRHSNFIFMNVTGSRADVVGLIHEIGHAVSQRATAQLPYMAFWGFPGDFSETPSCAMEVLSLPYWDEFYAAGDLPEVRRAYFRSMIGASLYGCMVDAFQHWAFCYPDAARDLAQCRAKSLELTQRYLPGIEWAGLESLHEMHLVGRAIGAPLHALEYFYGQLAGLHLLTLPADDAMAHYKAAIALGNSVPVTRLFEAMGIRFPIAEADISRAAADLAQRIE